jgi:hypothetical protein
MKDTSDNDDDMPNVCFITAYDEGYYSQFKESFPKFEKHNCFLRKPILLADLVKKGKITISIDYLVEYLKEEPGTTRCC